MNSNVRKALFFVLVVGVTFLGYRYMIQPANKVLAEQQTRVNTKTSKLAEFNDAEMAEQNLSDQLVQLQDAIKFFESKLPPKSQMHKVLEQVTVLAKKNGLDAKAIKTLAKKENSGYVEQPLTMELYGNFESLYSFLLELERLPRIMKVRKLDLQKLKGYEGQVRADCVISIFFQTGS